MMELETTPLVDGLVFPEDPRWHDGKLWFSDIHAQRVMTVDPAGHTDTVVDVPDLPSGLGWLPDGRLLMVSALERRLLGWTPRGLTEVADLRPFAPYPCNDMVVDSHGRAYVGHLGYDVFGGQPLAPGTILLAKMDGSVQVAAEGLHFPNGTVLTPDGSTLVVSESYAGRLTAFRVTEDGSLRERQVFFIEQVERHNPTHKTDTSPPVNHHFGHVGDTPVFVSFIIKHSYGVITYG